MKNLEREQHLPCEGEDLVERHDTILSQRLLEALVAELHLDVQALVLDPRLVVPHNMLRVLHVADMR